MYTRDLFLQLSDPTEDKILIRWIKEDYPSERHKQSRKLVNSFLRRVKEGKTFVLHPSTD